MNELIPVVVGGGIVYVLAKQSGPPMYPGDTAYQSPRPGATLGDIASGIPGGNGGASDYLNDGGQSAFNIDGRSNDPNAQAKLDLAQQAMKLAFDKLDAAGKSAAADKINQALDLNPPLKGNETWETVARVAGGAGGTALCNLIPGVGAVASPLCAMAGAYLGVQLEQWMSANMGDLQSWVSDNLGQVINNIGDDISDWFHSLF